MSNDTIFRWDFNIPNQLDFTKLLQ